VGAADGHGPVRRGAAAGTGGAPAQGPRGVLRPRRGAWQIAIFRAGTARVHGRRVFSDLHGGTAWNAERVGGRAISGRGPRRWNSTGQKESCGVQERRWRRRPAVGAEHHGTVQLLQHHRPRTRKGRAMGSAGMGPPRAAHAPPHGYDWGWEGRILAMGSRALPPAARPRGRTQRRWASTASHFDPRAAVAPPPPPTPHTPPTPTPIVVWFSNEFWGHRRLGPGFDAPGTLQLQRSPRKNDPLLCSLQKMDRGGDHHSGIVIPDLRGRGPGSKSAVWTPGSAGVGGAAHASAGDGSGRWARRRRKPPITARVIRGRFGLHPGARPEGRVRPVGGLRREGPRSIFDGVANGGGGRLMSASTRGIVHEEAGPPLGVK